MDPTSLLAQLTTIPDPRIKRGQRYPSGALLGLLVLGLLHGYTSQHACWLWGRAHWDRIRQPLGFVRPTYPSYNAFWDFVARLDLDAVAAVLGPWLEALAGPGVRVWHADGKVLRGSKRTARLPLHLVGLSETHLGAVVRQTRTAPSGDEVGALLRLVAEHPLEGALITLDAGLLNAAVTQAITVAAGAYLGVVKGNQPDVQQAVEDWLSDQLSPPDGVTRAERADPGSEPRTGGRAGRVGGGGGGVGTLPGGGMGLGGSGPGGLGATPDAAARPAARTVGDGGDEPQRRAPTPGRGVGAGAGPLAGGEPTASGAGCDL
jgi:DDE_Tnp_1-associated